jgi:hypothetical protein
MIACRTSLRGTEVKKRADELQYALFREVIAKVFSKGIASSRQDGTRKDILRRCGHCEECGDEAISINMTFAIGSHIK